MKVFLAGVESLYPENMSIVNGGNNLISFYSMNERAIPIVKGSKMFLLDSGAFSFLANNKKSINWDNYINQYAEFINKHNIKYFFELDIDPVVGYQNVLKYRAILEEKTGRRCIPVWHKSRGIEEYKKMCDEYDYVAIGGIVTREIVPEQYDVFIPMIREAHKRGAKVHGLGFTSTKLLKKIHFDSVDSTNWSYGRYGHYWKFTEDNEMKMITRPRGKKCGKRELLQAFNIKEWIKFQKYAEAHL